jgi:hypothetical protein
VHDLSLGGCRYRTDGTTHARSGDRLLLQLDVPAFEQPIRLRAVVIWRDQEETITEMGVCFTVLTDDSRRALERLIDDGKLRTIERVTQVQDAG